MRLSKKVWLVAGIAILAVVLGYLFMTYSQLVTEHRQLEGRLTVAQDDLPGLTTEKGTLESQRVSATSALASAKARFPEAVESIEYGEDFFRIAYGYDLSAMLAGLDLELTRLSASTRTARTEGTVTYSLSSFTVDVKGDVNDILTFIDAMGTQIHYQLPSWSFQVPWSVDVKGVTMNNMSKASASATISVDIYGYRG